jgi:hypothetical protein
MCRALPCGPLWVPVVKKFDYRFYRESKGRLRADAREVDDIKHVHGA